MAITKKQLKISMPENFLVEIQNDEFGEGIIRFKFHCSFVLERVWKVSCQRIKGWQRMYLTFKKNKKSKIVAFLAFFYKIIDFSNTLLEKFLNLLFKRR